jgi:hypothetical protein
LDRGLEDRALDLFENPLEGIEHRRLQARS